MRITHTHTHTAIHKHPPKHIHPHTHTTTPTHIHTHATTHAHTPYRSPHRPATYVLTTTTPLTKLPATSSGTHQPTLPESSNATDKHTKTHTNRPPYTCTRLYTPHNAQVCGHAPNANRHAQLNTTHVTIFSSETQLDNSLKVVNYVRHRARNNRQVIPRFFEHAHHTHTHTEPYTRTHPNTSTHTRTHTHQRTYTHTQPHTHTRHTGHPIGQQPTS